MRVYHQKIRVHYVTGKGEWVGGEEHKNIYATIKKREQGMCLFRGGTEKMVGGGGDIIGRTFFVLPGPAFMVFLSFTPFFGPRRGVVND